MSMLVIQCAECGVDTTFDERPAENPKATHYWKSTYERTDDCMFTVLRHYPYKDKKGRVKVNTLTEYILEVYCSPECGLVAYQKENG